MGEYLRNATLPQLLIYIALSAADFPNDGRDIWVGLRSATAVLRYYRIAQTVELVRRPLQPGGEQDVGPIASRHLFSAMVSWLPSLAD